MELFPWKCKLTNRVVRYFAFYRKERIVVSSKTRDEAIAKAFRLMDKSRTIHPQCTCLRTTSICDHSLDKDETAQLYLYENPQPQALNLV